MVVVLLVRVAADGNDADGGAGRVGDDDGLSGDVVLVLMVAGGAGSLLCFAAAAAAATATATATAATPPPAAPARLRGRTVGGRAVLQHSASWGRVLLHPLGALRGQHRLGG